jgi:small conductance mechanosensitive channel
MTEQADTALGALRDLIKGYGLAVLSAAVIAVVGWMASSWAARSVRKLGRRSERIDATLVPVLSSLSRLVLLTATAAAVLEKLGVDTKSLFAVLGAAGLTVGLALKDTLADVASGLVLLVLRPFDVGDAVDIDGTSGVIDAIDIFQTRLTSFDGVPIVLPNSKVRAARVQNFSRAERRRMDLTVGVSQGTDVGQAITALKEVLESEARVLREPTPAVDVVELGEDKVNLLVRAWTLPGDLLPTRLDLTRRLKERLGAEGVSIPAPQRELNILPRRRRSASAPPDSAR